MGEPMKLCKDCLHSGRFIDLWICRVPIAEVSPVTGEARRGQRYCEVERSDPTGCGPDGVYWEERA